MAFVRQQLMLPEDPATEELAVFRSPNVVLLSKKQRDSLLQSNNKANNSKSPQQDPEQNPGQQRQGQGVLCARKSSRGCGEVANLSLTLLQEEAQQQEKHASKGTPLLLSARSPGAAAAAAAAAVLMLPAHPVFPCSSSSTTPPPSEHHQHLVNQQREKCWSDAAFGAAATAPAAASAAAAAENRLSSKQVISAVATPRSCVETFPLTPMAVGSGPSGQAAAASTPAATAAPHIGQRLEAVKQCANRVREALRLESKISALLTHTERSSRRSSCSSRSSSTDKLLDGLKETFATPRPAAPRNESVELPPQLQPGNKSGHKNSLKVITPRKVSTGSGEWVTSATQEHLHHIQEPLQEQRQQQQALPRYEDNDCSSSSRESFVPSGQGTPGLVTRSLQCTPRASTDRSRNSRGAQLISSGASGPVVVLNTATASNAAASAEAEKAAEETVSTKQQDRVVVRLSLGGLACSSVSKSPRAAAAQAHDTFKQEELHKRHLEKDPPPQQQMESARRNSFVHSLKARADAYRDQQQQQQQQQDGIPITPKSSIFRTAISQASSSSSCSLLVSSTSSSGSAATGAAHWPQKVLAKLPPEVDRSAGGTGCAERRLEAPREASARGATRLNHDDEGDDREMELLLSEQAQCSFNDWVRSPMQ